MAYSSDVVRRARRELESRRADHASKQQARQQEIYAKLPRVVEIDKALRSSMVQAVQWHGLYRHNHVPLPFGAVPAGAEK